MKRMLIPAALACGALLMSISCGPGADMPGQAAGITPTAYHAAALKNGATVIVLPGTPDSGPLLALGARCAAGPANELKGEEGYSSVLGRLLSRTGKGSVSEMMAALGTTLTIDVQSDAIYLGAVVLKEDASAAGQAIARLLIEEPDSAAVEEARDGLVTSLEQTAAAGALEVRDLINGSLYPDLPSGADTATRIAALKALTPERFAAYRTRVINPSSLCFSLVGALDQETIESVCRVAETLPAGQTAAATEKQAEEKPAEEKHVPIRVLDRTDTGMVSLYLLRRLPAIPADDYYALQAANDILNGQSTFTRLTALQVAMRLAVPITSTMDLRGSDTGHMIVAQVPTANAAEIFARIMQQLEQIHDGTLLNSRLLEQEVADARNLLRGQLLRQTETPAQRARFMLWAHGAGFTSMKPADHLAMIEALDKDKMLKAVDAYMIPGLNTLIAIGPAASLTKQFSSYGEIQTVPSALK